MIASGILLLGGFALLAVLMVVRLLPTLLALPLMATWIAIIAGIPFVEMINDILMKGALRLGSPMIIVIFGAMFAKVIQKTGIANAIIKKAAELAGDKPFTIAILMSGATAFIFSGMSGLGAIIMIATIAVPIMTSAGIEPIDAVILILLGLFAGLAVNFSTLATAIGIFGSDAALKYYVPGICVAFLCLIIYIIINIPRSKSSDGSSFEVVKEFLIGIISVPKSFFQTVIKLFSKQSSSFVHKKKELPAAALITPILPLIIIAVANFTIGFGASADGKIDPTGAAMFGFVISSLYAALLIKPRETVNLFAGALVEGIQDVAGVIFLFMGIGMLVTASTHPSAVAILDPLMRNILPSSLYGVLIFFGLFAPTALYRGPFNMFGMGSGIASILMSVQFLPATILCGLFQAVNFLQNADPTNSQNTWLSGFTGVDTTTIMKKMLPYSWGSCILLLIIVAIRQ